MIPSAAAQHRSKHFEQLLERELAYIERGHEQNLITYGKLERVIDRDRKRTTNIKRKRFSFPPIDEDSSGHSEVSHSSFITSTVVNNQSDVSETQQSIIPKFHRQCYKAYRLPPIVKATRSTPKKTDLHWIAFNTIQSPSNKSDTITLVNEELPKKTSPVLSPIEKQIHSFIESLPTYKGVHKGFDNFAPAALYSTRTPVAMR